MNVVNNSDATSFWGDLPWPPEQDNAPADAHDATRPDLEPVRQKHARGEATTTAMTRATPRPADDAFVGLHSKRGISHQPALDGLRGLALCFVLAYHGGWGATHGGFVGLSLFFVLSGFLIGSLLLHEASQTGTVDLRKFYERRFRRLLPIAAVTLAVVFVVWSLRHAMTPQLRTDIGWSYLYAANWRFISSGNSYAALFVQASPVTHFWSLAIEEQFYLVIPLVWALTLRWSRSNARRVLMWLIGGVALVSVVYTLVANLNADRVYYGTDTRMAELAIGLLLGFLLSPKQRRITMMSNQTLRRSLQAAGPVALVAMVLIGTRFHHDHPFFANGGFAVLAILASAVVISALIPGSWMSRFLAWGPLVAFGRISYGFYVVHWPILILMSANVAGPTQWLRFVVAMVLSLVLAWMSHRYFEEPIRRAKVLSQRTVWVAVATALVLGLVAVGLPASSAPSAVVESLDSESAQAVLAPTRPQDSPPAPVVTGAPATGPSANDPLTSVPPTVDPPARKPVVSMFGDSVAFSMWLAMNKHSNASQQYYDRGKSITVTGCGIVRGGLVKSLFVGPNKPECDAWEDTWGPALDESHPDVAVIVSCGWELVDRSVGDSTELRSLGDPVFDQRVTEEYLAAMDFIVKHGVNTVLWATCPKFSHNHGEPDLPVGIRESRADDRVDKLNALIVQTVARRSDHVAVFGFEKLMANKIEDGAIRPDGAHFEHDSDTGISTILNSELVATIDKTMQSRSSK